MTYTSKNKLDKNISINLRALMGKYKILHNVVDADIAETLSISNKTLRSHLSDISIMTLGELSTIRDYLKIPQEEITGLFEG